MTQRASSLGPRREPSVPASPQRASDTAPPTLGRAVMFTPGVLAGVAPQTKQQTVSFYWKLEFWSLPASAVTAPDLQAPSLSV